MSLPLPWQAAGACVLAPRVKFVAAYWLPEFRRVEDSLQQAAELLAYLVLHTHAIKIKNVAMQKALEFHGRSVVMRDATMLGRSVLSSTTR